MRVRLFLAAIALLAAFAASGLLPNPLIETSSTFNRDVTVGMGVVYTSLRVLKGVLTMAADANFSAGVAVVNFEGSPGQLVTPVIDTIERMANLVFALMIASGLLAVLIPALGTWAAAAVSGAAVLLILLPSGHRGNRWAAGAGSAARSLLLLGLMGAVVVPGAYALSSFLGDEYLRSASTGEAELHALTEPYRLSQEQIVAPPPAEPPTETTPAPPAEQNIWDYMTGQIGGAISSVGNAGAQVGDTMRSFGAGTLDQVRTSIASVGSAIERAEQLLNLLVALAVAYILKLFALPLITLVVVVAVGRAALRPWSRVASPLAGP